MAEEQHKERVRELAARFAADHPKMQPDEWAAAIGARVHYGNLGDKDGMYDPQRNLILLPDSGNPKRRRFTAAHEVVHSLILGDGDLLSDLHDAYEGEELEVAIEVLCNTGAAAILIPPPDLEYTIGRYGGGAAVIPRLCTQFDVSPQTACIALAGALPTKSIVAMLKARGRGAGKHLVVDFSTRAPSMRYSMAEGTRIPDTSPATLAWQTGLQIEQDDFIPFRTGRRMPAVVDAHPEGATVYAVFTSKV